MNKLRLKYFLKIFFTPMSWIRNYKTDKTWDKTLWELASNLQNFKAIGGHHAIIGENLVWIENHPYASGLRSDSTSHHKASCSRVTALYLRDQLKKAQVLLLLKGIDRGASDHLIFVHKIEDFS